MEDTQNITKSQEERLIDVEAVFRQKNPKLFKAIPGFVFTYLKK